MRTLYVTYSIQTDKGSGVGRATVQVGWEGLYRPSFRFSEIQTIERNLLADLKQRTPSASSLFLLDWKWLRDEAPSEAPITTEAGDA